MPDITLYPFAHDIGFHIAAQITWSKSVNSIGLILDITGAIVLWIFALPSRLEEGVVRLAHQRSKSITPAEEKRFNQWSEAGVVCLGLGFLLQLISNFI
jgi:hypothetical protein